MKTPQKQLIKQELFKTQNHCKYCGIFVSKRTATIDHIEPIINGGTDDMENLCLSCRWCNSTKSNYSFDYFTGFISFINNPNGKRWQKLVAGFPFKKPEPKVTGILIKSYNRTIKPKPCKENKTVL